jgi:hypothetical protein
MLCRDTERVCVGTQKLCVYRGRVCRGTETVDVWRHRAVVWGHGQKICGFTRVKVCETRTVGV